MNLLDPALYARGASHEAFRTLRAREGPVAPLAETPSERSWAVLGHHEVRAVLTDPARYSSAHGTRPGLVKPAGAPASLNQLDPPAHGPLRALAERALAPRERARVARFARIFAHRCTRALFAPGPHDGVTDLAHPLALATLGAWLGLDERERDELGAALARSHAAGEARLDPRAPAATREPRAHAARRAKEQLHEHFDRWIATARAGALASLRASTRAGACTEAQARGLAVLFAEAGYVTARDAVGNALAGCLADPARHRWLRRHAGAPAQLARFVEEGLRLDPPVVQFARTAARAVTLGARELRAGDRVVLFFPAANRDPSVYSQPDRFDPARARSPHLAFGAGPHACVGASLARVQLRAVCAALAAEARALEPAGPAVRRASNYLAGYERLPLT